MKHQKFCVYNQTCECFLSLELTLYRYATEIVGKHTLSLVEESWLIRSKDHDAFVVSTSCDLVYLDKRFRAIQVVESFPTLRVARWRDGAASVLALPIHTIYSSQTHAGHQFIISGAEEMELQLRTIANLSPPMESRTRALDAELPRCTGLETAK